MSRVAQRLEPSRAVRIRDQHRTWLTIHFLVLAGGLVAAFAVNRFLTPETFWAQWVALAWGLAFGAHVAVFARATLATMGRRKKPGPD
ncbi:MAG TPA: hypothetical protein VKN99_05260 [Polyangia bacterium]|nr:hypothetical protein [Polyangia bacterium]